MEREQREIERERQEREEKEKKEQEKAKGKGKAAKGISKHNLPIDMADSVVGRSPGLLAETLTSTWGSQSKAVTPPASPWPLAKSVGPSAPKTRTSSLHGMRKSNYPLQPHFLWVRPNRYLSVQKNL